ncbi:MULTISPECIES: FtsW/RodA/SpoVE family cell cycle protein [unclassified Ruminococcus]|uniref:FtsW/RodA/SpoVE family cell cycle protein n=1 Tax=unclassified Ruminococcus TaxID=2608920 RepID=UPI00210E6BD3
MDEFLQSLNIQVITDIAIVALRILIPLLGIIVVFQCYSSMRRQRRDEKPLIMLENTATGEVLPVLCWENSIGRANRNDIVIADDLAVSREHCVILRRKEGWFISDTGSKTGTFVNGEQTQGRVPIFINDEIKIGKDTFILKRAQDYTITNRSWFIKKEGSKEGIAPFALMMLISIFTLFMAAEACLSIEANDFQPLVVYAAFMAVAWIFYIVSTKVFKRVGFELEGLALFLTGIGVMLSVRQGLHQTYVQIIACAIGMAFFCFMIKFLQNPDRVNKWRLAIMIIAVGFLAVNIVFGTIRGGAANWIMIGGVSIQPSEFVKIAYIFVGASALDQLQTKKNFIVFIIFSAICIGALFIMSDFGTALIFFGTFIMISIVRSGDYKTVVVSIVGAIFGGLLILRFKPYIADRFSGWGKAFENSDNSLGYQTARVLTYAASGGLFGCGLGNGYLKYVGASESDLVFGLVCEELGLIVALTIAVSIGGLFFYARAITTKSRSTFYSISACCAAGLLVLQSSLNIFGATDILPLTGVTLPFISVGGSSMIACWGLLAFIKAADERTYSIKKR